ncbi:hypothetical protein OG884_25200 [Streptosporangium sp. NBC_01755]|uniref:hypothetical protein n=1 Tax=unclassified Streptosporangium TaxID=2632669 RepID=UPI002DD90A45|nr:MULTISPECIES: hypothetical protein [unclassified Streptosporangium]WSA23619.1 hypothetical protein OIE13_22010 [Streptosporangium sp. NBC_01810]WSC98168.1 hypothetical protein OG884_25200 [Streptosporangium sp. NBC_01755]
MKRTTISTLAIAGVLTLGLSACSDSTTAEGGKPWPAGFGNDHAADRAADRADALVSREERS